VACARYGQETTLPTGVIGQVKPDAATQPPTIYQALAAGAGFTADADGARELRKRGFQADEVELSQDDRAWLVRNVNAAFAKGTVWRIACPAGRIARDLAGDVSCVTLAGYVGLDFAQAAAQRGTDLSKDMGAAYSWVSPTAVRFRFLKGTQGASPQALQDAERSARALESMAKAVRAMEPVMAQLAEKLPWSIRGSYARALTLLVESAQPLRAYRAAYPAKGSAARLGALPPVPPVVLWAVVIIGAIGGVLIWLAYKQEDHLRASAELQVAQNQLPLVLAELARDPAQPKEVRRAAAQALQEWMEKMPPPPAPPADPLSALTDFLKVAAPVAGVGFLLYAAAPMLRELGRTGAEQVRQRRSQRMLPVEGQRANGRA
jgi:uncharacterized protein (UPF0147 family)